MGENGGWMEFPSVLITSIYPKNSIFHHSFIDRKSVRKFMLSKHKGESSLPNYTLVFILFSPRIVALLGFFAGSLEQSQETSVASNAASCLMIPIVVNFRILVSRHPLVKFYNVSKFIYHFRDGPPDRNSEG